MAVERFTLDTNILFYSIDRDAGIKQVMARRIIDLAIRADCRLTLQAVSEFYPAWPSRCFPLSLRERATDMLPPIPGFLDAMVWLTSYWPHIDAPSATALNRSRSWSWKRDASQPSRAPLPMARIPTRWSATPSAAGLVTPSTILRGRPASRR